MAIKRAHCPVKVRFEAQKLLRMRKLLSIAKWGVTLGRDPQNFLGAGWITSFLARVPEASKRKWALRLLALSPHYFIDGNNPEFRGMRNDEYLERSFRIIADTRVAIYEKVLKPFVSKDDSVIDYGCGPGFVAKAVAPYVRSIKAVDISSGAVACAKVVNAADNIEYILADAMGIGTISDNSVDAVYSYAVVQHLTDEVFDHVLRVCSEKLRPGGRLILHVQLPDMIWRTESEWRGDASLQGKVKFKYGLHCFGRTEEQYAEFLHRHGFIDLEFYEIEKLFERESDELASQRLLIANKRQ